MEGQRVKHLTEGYLRGWLSFKYPLDSSYLREELILEHIEESKWHDALEHKLFIETVLRAGMQSRNLDPIYETKDTLLGIKLPSTRLKDKIKEKSISKDMELTPENIQEWKATIAAAKERFNKDKK